MPDSSLRLIEDLRLVRNFSYVGGKWVAAADGSTLTVTDPADGAVVGEVASLSAEESAEAVTVAQEAFPKWSSCLLYTSDAADE